MKEDLKRLDNYQLYSLIQSSNVDDELKQDLVAEYDARNISEQELDRIKSKHDVYFSDIKSDIKEQSWSPVFTAFALRKHFQHLAYLNTMRMKKEARAYLFQLCLGIALYWLIAMLFFSAIVAYH